MNLKLESKVSKSHFENWLRYFKDCGYEVTERKQYIDNFGGSDLEETSYYAYSCEWYGNLTPIAVSMNLGQGRKVYYTYLRLPLNVQSVKKAPPSHKRFCPSCASLDVVRKHINYDAVASHEGVRYEFTIMDFQPLHCNNCNETIFDDEADDQISKALQKHLKR